MKQHKRISGFFAALMALVLLTSQMGFTAFAAAESLDYSAMVTDQIVAKGKPVSKTLVDFQFLYGDFDAGSLQAFQKWFGGGGTPDDTLANPADVATPDNGQNVLWRWQWRATATSATVLKVTAKEDMKLDVTQKDTIKDQWATHSAFRFVTESADGVRMPLRRMDVTATMKPEDVKTTAYLSKGDTLYIVYSIMNGDPGTATATYIPQFQADPSGYDAAQRPAYEKVAALDQLKTDKEKALKDKYTQMTADSSTYSTARAAEIKGIVNEAAAKISDLTSEEEINTLFNETVTKMEAVPTQAKEKEELQAYMNTQKQELTSYVSKEEYTSANWQKVQGYLDEGIKKIDEAQSAAAVNTAVARAKASIDKVEKKQGVDMMPWIVSGGMALAVVIVAVVVVIVVLRKSKRKEKTQ